MRIQNFGQLNLNNTGIAPVLTKEVKLDGGILNNAAGSNSAGTTPAATGFATWNGSIVGVLPTTATNPTTPAAADDSIYSTATTLAAIPNQTTNTLISSADVIIPSGTLLTVASGGIVMRGADHSINTAAAGTGRLMTGAAGAASFVQNNISLTGRGAGENAGYLGALRMGANNTLSVNLTVSSDVTRIHNQNGTAAIAGILKGTGTILWTGNNVTWVTNPASTFSGVSEFGYRVEGTGTIANSAAGTTSTLTLGGSLTGVGNGSSRIGGGLGATIANGAGIMAITKAGTGTIALTGANTYRGETHVNQGVLSVSAFGTTGTLGSGPVFNDATLAFARTNTITVDNVIGGSGQVVQVGGGTLQLNGANTFTGGLVVSAGTVRSDRGYAPLNPTGGVFFLGGTQTLALSNTEIASGAGYGPITLGDAITGAAAVSFLSDNGADFSNPITVSSSGTGTASIGSNSGPSTSANPAMFTGAITLNRATTFLGNNPDRTTYLGVIGGNPGIITISGTTAGTNGGNLNRTTWENTNTFTGNVVVAANSTLQIGTGAFAAPLDQIPDTADVTLNATSFFTLNGDSETIGTNTYTGLTAINDGTLQIGDAGTTGTLGTGNVTVIGTLAFNKTNVLPVPNAITGTGLVRQDGTGTITLTGALDFPQLDVNDGRLNLNSTLANATINDNNGILNVNANAVNSTVNVNDRTFFIVSQTLAALNITGSGVAVLGGPAGSPEGAPSFEGHDLPAIGGSAAEAILASSAVQGVPEPGAASLLLLGALRPARTPSPGAESLRDCEISRVCGRGRGRTGADPTFYTVSERPAFDRSQSKSHGPG